MDKISIISYKKSIDETTIEIGLKGRVDAITYEDFESVVREALDNGYRNIIVNLGEVDFFGSSGIKVLLMVYKRLDSKIVLKNVPEYIKRMIKTLNIESFFTIEN